MRDEDRNAEPTTRGAAVRLPSAEALTLLVVGEGTSSSHALPSEGAVVIGRGDNADIRVDDPAMSRRHARLHVGDKLQVEDLGSANGTVVRSTALTPHERVDVMPGVAIELGSTVVIVQAPPGYASGRPRALSRAGSLRPRRVQTHGYFEVRLEEAASQAGELSRPLAVLRVHLVDADPDEKAPELLSELLRPTDVLASYGPGEYEILLIDTAPADAEQRRRALETACGRAGLRVRIGLARLPEDGRSPETLLERAHAEAKGLTPDPQGRAIIIQDRVMVRLHKLIERVAQGNISVLLLGETGVGKEVLAEAVHRASPRASGPYVKLNCAALTESLFESELFGHEKGAFTGAVKTKLGLLETANGGTLFLDEVGEMPASIQVKLLRVLEERRALRVGGLEERELDVRFVAATNRNLEDEIERGRFRQDLYYRLNGIALVVPPLRERVSEIEGLVQVFVKNAARGLGQARVPRVRADALEVLKSYGWPGNIRELRNVMERAVLLAGEEDVGPDHLPLEKMGGTVMSSRLFGAVPLPARGISVATGRPRSVVPDEGGRPTIPVRPTSLDDDDLDERTMERSSPLHEPGTSSWEAERQRIIDALDRCAGNQSTAAKLLGMSRRTLVTRLVTHRIPRPRKPLPGE